MPQGDGSASGAPTKSTYSRKRSAAEMKKGGANVGTSGMALQNAAFKAGLGKMISDIEAITAAKLVKSGAGVQLSDIKRIGAGEIKSSNKKRARPNAISRILSRGKNLKGVRGDFDISELADLDDELKVFIDHRRKTAGGGEKKSGSASAGTGGGGASAAVAAAPVAPLDASVRPRGMGKAAAEARAGGTGSARSALRTQLTLPKEAAGTPATAGGLFASDAQVSARFGSDFA
jgi:hypothetical protein